MRKTCAEEMSAMTSKGEQMVVPVSMFRRAEMAKSFQVQRIETIEEEMDSGQMRLEAMGYKQVSTPTKRVRANM